MISAERLAALQFEAEHKGISAHRHAAMVKAGTPMPEHATMVAVTPAELRALLEAYAACQQHDAAAGEVRDPPSLDEAGREACTSPPDL